MTRRDAQDADLGGQPVKMTPRMAEVAIALFLRHGEIVSRAQLYEQTRGRKKVPAA